MRVTYIKPTIEYSKLTKDMAQQNHLLIAGATGSGKSVVENNILHYLLGSSPLSVKLILIDPKKVDMRKYMNLPHVLRYASEKDEIVSALEYAVRLTEDRFRDMAKRGLEKYDGSHVYVFIDEYADLVTTDKRRTQPLVQRLAQIGRAASVHVILCTQTPIAKILTTEIKCNFDSRVGLRSRSAQDSRNIIGISGLEQLPVYGMCYYMTPGHENFYDVPMTSREEIDRVINWWLDPAHTIEENKGKSSLFSRLFGGKR